MSTEKHAGDEEVRGPLTGIRVIEMGTMIAGPVVATLLADFGAEVIKIEHPEGGDPIRNIGPFVNGESLWWNVEGRNKRSITIDLHLPAGQSLVRDLVLGSDLVVENFRPGTMDKWNLSYGDLSKVNPRLVMLSVSGYGQTGPYAQRPAYDRIALAFAGMLNMTGFPDRPPLRPGTAMADYQSALYGAFAAMVALFNRDAKSGTGQHIDLSLYESIFRFTDVMLTAYDKVGAKRERRGNEHFAAAPGDHFPTRDGKFVALTVSNNAVFARLCRAIGQTGLIEDPRFSSHTLRAAHLQEINSVVADWISAVSHDELRAAFDAEGVAYSFVYTVEDILNDPHYQARESFVTVDHPRMGPLKMQGVMPRMTGTPSSRIRIAPELGSDTDEILKSLLGLTVGEIAALRSDGVC
nr:L-carnitine dehydratase/bile acid-inducible protein F [uncultured bacterium]